MRPRATLLLIIAAVLVLPAAGWQLVKQSESLLREGQERAQVGAAAAISRALAAITPTLPPGGPALYVNPLAAPIVLDGARDDWADYPGAQGTDGGLAVAIAEDDSRLMLMIEVEDPTRVRADVGQPMSAPGDRVVLEFIDPSGRHALEFGNAAPGALQVGGDATLAGLTRGEWQESAQGYRIELAVARPALGSTMVLYAVDEHEDGTPSRRIVLPAGVEPMAMIRADPRLDRALAVLTPDGGRLRLVSTEGWVLARAGQLGVAEGAAPTQQRIKLNSLLYWLLLAPRDERAALYAETLPRLEAPVVWQALSGIAASSVRASARQNSVIVTAAVPFRVQGVARGALLLEQPSRALLLLSDRAVFNVIAASLLAVMLAAGVLLGYAGRQSVRIRRLRDAAERALRPDGRLDVRLPHLAVEDDLGDLSRSFGRLLSEVGAYTDYLRSLGSKLSHELNTPLAIVRSSLDNLELESLPDEARVYAERARDGADRLGKILRALSEASRVEHAIRSAEAETFDLAELVRGIGGSYRELVAPRRLDLVAPTGPVPFQGAPDLIGQALDKLIDNARSFGPADGWIRLELARAADGVRLTVSNQGPPLPKKMQDQLFDSLVSVRDKATPGEVAHLGLGLYIVRLIAELHGGYAEAANLHDGSGVEVALKLAGMPLTPPQSIQPL